MNVKVLMLSVLAAAAPFGSFAASCDADAELTAQMAKTANENNRLEEAVGLYSNAGQACGRFDYWIAAADILAKDPLTGPEYAETGAQDQAAVRAYREAYLAGNSAEDLARASRGIASVGVKTDPTNAGLWLINARNYGAAGPDVVRLEARVQEATAELSKAELEAGFGTRGPGKGGSILWSVPDISRKTMPNVGPPSVKADNPIAGGGGGDGARPPGGSQGSLPVSSNSADSVNISLNFIAGSTTLDARTAGNVANLALVLAESFKGQSIRFVGHADVRGDADMNRRLSLERARAVRSAVLDLQPALRGQIAVDGRGEDEPLEPGASESAYRTNRRLQVVIVK